MKTNTNLNPNSKLSLIPFLMKPTFTSTSKQFASFLSIVFCMFFSMSFLMATNINAKAIAPKNSSSSKWQSTLDHAKDGQMIMLPASVNEALTVRSFGKLMASNATVAGPVHNITQMIDYATIQAAIDAANANDIILCDAATYTESINIHKAVTLRGANFGIPGIGGRAPEAILLNCTIDINNAGNTTIDGFHILRNDGNTGPTNQIELDGGGVNTVQNCIIERNGSNTGQAIRALATTTAGGNKIITNNKIFGDASGGLFSGHKSWNNGIYIDQGPFTVSITSNTILNCRSGLNIDDMNNSVTVSGNTINNNGTHISFGAAVPTTGSFVLGSNDFINNAASTMINLSNVNANFRLDITSSTLSGVAFNALTNTQLFDVEARMAHKEVTASKKGKVIYLTNKQYVNNFTVPITKIDKIQNSINYGDAGDTIYLEDGTYSEKLIIDRSNLSIQGVTGDKTLYIIDGTTQGTTSGIVLNNGMTNITIKNLTVQKFTGTSGNSHAGIYGNGGNDPS